MVRDVTVRTYLHQVFNILSHSVQKDLSVVLCKVLYLYICLAEGDVWNAENTSCRRGNGAKVRQGYL